MVQPSRHRVLESGSSPAVSQASKTEAGIGVFAGRVLEVFLLQIHRAMTPAHAVGVDVGEVRRVSVDRRGRCS